LGRFTHEKGPHIAIRLAQQTHLLLRIAAKIPRMETHYFEEQIEPLLDGDHVEFVGEVNDSHKQDFLGNAMAVLFPIDWPEPFGLVMSKRWRAAHRLLPGVADQCPKLSSTVTKFASNSITLSAAASTLAVDEI
jgi:glycosyltransferase involved in cell wall biosynthesis